MTWDPGAGSYGIYPPKYKHDGSMDFLSAQRSNIGNLELVQSISKLCMSSAHRSSQLLSVTRICRRASNSQSSSVQLRWAGHFWTYSCWLPNTSNTSKPAWKIIHQPKNRHPSVSPSCTVSSTLPVWTMFLRSRTSSTPYLPCKIFIPACRCQKLHRYDKKKQAYCNDWFPPKLLERTFSGLGDQFI